MTYRDLLNQINRLSDEQLNQTVTVHTLDEYFPVKGSAFSTEESTDVLDPNHFYLEVE